MDKLAALRRANLEGGGADRVGRISEMGKLGARQRIDQLADPGSFEELGSAVTDSRPPYDGVERPSPSDGIVMGLARIEGRPLAVYATDFTVMSGALGDQAAWKLADLVQMAGRMQIPIVGLVDSAGERLSFKNGDSGLSGLSTLIRNYCLYSGIIPRITLLLGPCTGTFANICTLSDFVVISREHGFLWLGGDIESDDAGGADFHMEKSGQCDLIAENEAEAFEQLKTLMRFLPRHCGQKPDRIDSKDDPDRREQGLLDVMPDDPKFTYDMHEVIDMIVDDGEFFELKADFAPNLITGFARFDGYAAGIVASNPDELSGILEPDSSDKYDRFMNFLDAFNIPLVTLVDTTAFPPGDRWERQGVIRHGAKLLHSYANLTCPKVTMVLRRSYGGANIVMGCSKMFPDFIYAWPTVEFAPTGPETVVHAVFHKELAKAREEGNYEEVYNFFLAILKEQFSVMNLARHWTTYYTVHEIIDPRDTRPRIVKALAATRSKRETLPPRRRSIKPA